MKNLKYLYAFVLLIIGFGTLSAQLDTLNYLKQFEANKANYINQPLSVLLNDMTQIQPKTAWSASHGRKKTITPGTRFKFCDMELSFHNTITLLVEWQSPIPRDQTKYYEQKNGFYFTNEERVFYGNKIIKNIVVYR
ncbi:hypothetical protein PGH12_09170 [Chryseobacterium wangxinyae]|uniref:hypothetical protein n=1 Tax=Chryseobacterium sp. CY350 TaxID=2997336 RepID=UPI002271CD29|nr:hypothetical protein [Chryseobacterium sp. CY350]MCY0978967.1 hypothetical protein [Chryseobacterium sp. CY350]WBZ97304.1 hypothetical protein PGH12_09170 [Chryseobacterium sp. CY350]